MFEFAVNITGFDYVEHVHNICPWCGTDRRAGTHGIERHDDNGVTMSCTITVQVMNPRKLGVVEAIS